MRLRLFAAFVIVIGVIAYLAVTTQAPEADRAERALLPGVAAGRVAVPVVTTTGVTFYAEGDQGSSPRVVSDLTGWGERPDGTFDFTVGRMHQIAGTNWYTLTAPADQGARIEYLFAYGAGDYRVDPHNARRAKRAGGDASEVVLPGFQEPPEFADAAEQVPAGKIQDVMVKGAIVRERRVIIYTPPGYNPEHRYQLAVFHDGDLVVNTGHAPRVLDWLIAHNAIHPIVAAFVDPASRADDFRLAAPMRDFVGGELVPWLSARYSLTPVAADHAIIGISAGARAALDAMASYPNVFGKSALLIPALDDADVARIPVHQAEVPQLDVFVLGARYDALNFASVERLRASLDMRGQAVKVMNVPEGHSTATWRNHLRDALISLFGR